MRVGHIFKQEYDENDVLLEVDVPTSLVGKLAMYRVSED